MRIYGCCLLSIFELLYNFLCGPLNVLIMHGPLSTCKVVNHSKETNQVKPLVC